MKTYEYKQIEELLKGSHKFGFKIKIASDNKETNWLYISEEILKSFQNNFK